MTINLECVVFYGDNFFVDVELPDDIKFHEFCRYNHKQRFYVTICKDDKKLYRRLSEKMCGRCNCYVFGDYMILELHQCHPTNEDLPLISLDELNGLFDEHIKGYYIKSERPSKPKTIEKIKGNKIESLEEAGPGEKNIGFINDDYKHINPMYYTEYIAKPLGFVDNVGEYLSMVFGIITLRSWLSDEYQIHSFEVKITQMKNFDVSFKDGQKITISNSKDIEKEYQEEIAKLLEMDNFNHIDYREEY